MSDLITYIQSSLVSMQDEKYRSFDLPLIPTVEQSTVLGVRFPKIKKLAKEIYAHRDKDIFLTSLPHRYYEENCLHAFIICLEKDLDRCICLLNRFLPFVDNWATCDSISPKEFKKHPDGLMGNIKVWISSEHTYTVRFGIKCLMSYYLDEHFSPDILATVADIRSEEYYINMMIAWFFATALAKQYESTIPYLEENRLSRWCHNKTISKAIDSYRITPEQKAYLRTLRIK